MTVIYAATTAVEIGTVIDVSSSASEISILTLCLLRLLRHLGTVFSIKAHVATNHSYPHHTKEGGIVIINILESKYTMILIQLYTCFAYRHA